MRFGSDHLRSKALLALEEAAQECRYAPVSGTFAIRFALAYLWSLKPTDRAPFDTYWRCLPKSDMWRFSSVDQALMCIYRHLDLPRDDEIGMRLWRRCEERRRKID